MTAEKPQPNLCDLATALTAARDLAAGRPVSALAMIRDLVRVHHYAVFVPGADPAVVEAVVDAYRDLIGAAWPGCPAESPSLAMALDRALAALGAGPPAASVDEIRARIDGRDREIAAVRAEALAYHQSAEVHDRIREFAAKPEGK